MVHNNFETVICALLTYVMAGDLLCPRADMQSDTLETYLTTPRQRLIYQAMEDARHKGHIVATSGALHALLATI